MIKSSWWFSSELWTDGSIQTMIENSTVVLRLTLRRKKVGLGIVLDLLNCQGETLRNDMKQTIDCKKKDPGPINCLGVPNTVIDLCLLIVVVSRAWEL